MRQRQILEMIGLRKKTMLVLAARQRIFFTLAPVAVASDAEDPDNALMVQDSANNPTNSQLPWDIEMFKKMEFNEIMSIWFNSVEEASLCGNAMAWHIDCFRKQSKSNFASQVAELEKQLAAEKFAQSREADNFNIKIEKL